MARLQHVCPNKGCRVYALAAGGDDKGDDEQESTAHLDRKRRRDLIMKNEHDASLRGPDQASKLVW